jgi:hypothetical protein
MDVTQYYYLSKTYFEETYQYVQDNIIGLLLFVFTFFIIYWVDYLNQINMSLMAVSPYISTLKNTINTTQSMTIPTNSSKRVTKRKK